MKKLLSLCMALTLLPAMLPAQDGLKQRYRYLLRAGDTLDLEYRLTPEFNQTVIVAPDGYVNLYIAGDVKIGGLTLTQAHDLILEKESARLNQPELNLVLKDFERPFVVVAGEVQNPGRIPVREDMTALQALLLAGGVKDTGKASQVVLYRRIDTSDSEVRVLNLNNIHHKPQLEHDTAVQPGDMLLVPVNTAAKIARLARAIPIGLGLNLASFFP